MAGHSPNWMAEWMQVSSETGWKEVWQFFQASLKIFKSPLLSVVWTSAQMFEWWSVHLSPLPSSSSFSSFSYNKLFFFSVCGTQLANSSQPHEWLKSIVSPTLSLLSPYIHLSQKGRSYYLVAQPPSFKNTAHSPKRFWMWRHRKERQQSSARGRMLLKRFEELLTMAVFPQ